VLDLPRYQFDLILVGRGGLEPLNEPGDTLVSCLPIGTLLPNQSGNPDSAEQLGIAIVRPDPFHDQTVP